MPKYYRPKRRHPGAVNLPRSGRAYYQRVIQRLQAQTGMPCYLWIAGTQQRPYVGPE